MGRTFLGNFLKRRCVLGVGGALALAASVSIGRREHAQCCQHAHAEGNGKSRNMTNAINTQPVSKIIPKKCAEIADMERMLCRFITFFLSIKVSLGFICFEKSIEKIFHPIDCTKYYQCENGVYRLLRCEEGHQFDRHSNTCRMMTVKGCVNKILLNVQNPHCPSDQTATTVFPHESECTKFYQCANGVLTVMVCYPGTEFHAGKGYCDLISETGCTSRNQNFPITEPVTSSPTEISFSENTNPEESTTQITTTEQVPIENTITGEPFNEILNITKPMLNDTLLTSTNPLCSGVGAGLFPHEKYCNKYYFCLNGNARVLQCANGQEFNPNKKTCVDAVNSGCKISQTVSLH